MWTLSTYAFDDLKFQNQSKTKPLKFATAKKCSESQKSSSFIPEKNFAAVVPWRIIWLFHSLGISIVHSGARVLSDTGFKSYLNYPWFFLSFSNSTPSSSQSAGKCTPEEPVVSRLQNLRMCIAPEAPPVWIQFQQTECVCVCRYQRLPEILAAIYPSRRPSPGSVTRITHSHSHTHTITQCHTWWETVFPRGHEAPVTSSSSFFPSQTLPENLPHMSLSELESEVCVCVRRIKRTSVLHTAFEFTAGKSQI